MGLLVPNNSRYPPPGRFSGGWNSLPILRGTKVVRVTILGTFVSIPFKSCLYYFFGDGIVEIHFDHGFFRFSAQSCFFRGLICVCSLGNVSMALLFYFQRCDDCGRASDLAGNDRKASKTSWWNAR